MIPDRNYGMTSTRENSAGAHSRSLAPLHRTDTRVQSEITSSDRDRAALCVALVAFLLPPGIVAVLVGIIRFCS